MENPTTISEYRTTYTFAHVHHAICVMCYRPPYRHNAHYNMRFARISTHAHYTLHVHTMHPEIYTFMQAWPTG